MEFTFRKTKINVTKYIDLISKYTQEKAFITFFSEKNLAQPKEPSGVEINGEILEIDLFFGRSSKKAEDIIAVNREYHGRVPSDYLIIGQINEIDFFCLRNNKFYFWERYKNDLYFDMNNPNYYKKQNTDLQLISDGFCSFLEKIKPIDISDMALDDLEDDYENPNIPFADEDIAHDFLHPELFFKQSDTAIKIQLNKLKLSEKGKLLLLLFKDKGFI